MADKKFLDVGVIRHVQGKNNSGEEYSFLSIELKQNVDILVDGQKVDFKTFTVGDKTLQNKTVSISPVKESLDRLADNLENGKISQEMHDGISEKLIKKNVKYTLGISAKNQA